MGRWEGGGWEAEGELKQTLKHNGSAVPSIGDPDWHN